MRNFHNDSLLARLFFRALYPLPPYSCVDWSPTYFTCQHSLSYVPGRYFFSFKGTMCPLGNGSGNGLSNLVKVSAGHTTVSDDLDSKTNRIYVPDAPSFSKSFQSKHFEMAKPAKKLGKKLVIRLRSSQQQLICLTSQPFNRRDEGRA